MKRTIWRSRPSAGMTLAELLVAMIILLVGIYAIVRGFPPLFRNIEAERVRTEMARLAENTLERLKTDSERIPEAIAGHDPVTMAVINPYSEPDETADVQDGNSHDDLRWVLAETIKVPAPDVGQSVAAYPFGLGPAASHLISTGPDVWALQGAARELTALQRLGEVPMGSVPAGTFYLGPDGTLELPSGYTAAMVDYCWVQRDGVQHYVWDEYIPAGAQVRAAALDSGTSDPSDFVNVLPNTAVARGVTEYYPILCGGPGDVTPGAIVLEQNFGATLLFHQSHAGRVFQIDYSLKSDDDANGNPRRVPLMMEEVPAPTVEPYVVELKFRNLDDEHPLYETDMVGVGVTPVFVLIVDTQSGATWTDNDGFVSLDVVNGKLTLDWDWTDPEPPYAPAPLTADQARGHKLRIYYRTLDRHNIQVMKAPRFFVDDRVAATYDPASAVYVDGGLDAVDYRTYSTATSTVGTELYTTLTFPASMAGQGVAVDYLCGAAAPYRRVSNEFHVVNAGDPHTVVLGEPDVRAIVAVQGLSLTVRGWWETERGQLQRLDVASYVNPKSLL